MANRGVNKVILVGILGKDPEVRYSPSGKAMANFTIATSETWKDKNTGEKQEKTEWHKVVVFGRLAEICGEYLRKGSKVFIDGKLQTRKWQDKDGQDRYTTEVVANEMQMLGGNVSQNNNNQQSVSQSAQNDTQQAPPGGFDDFDDDIPF